VLFDSGQVNDTGAVGSTLVLSPLTNFKSTQVWTQLATFRPIPCTSSFRACLCSPPTIPVLPEQGHAVAWNVERPTCQRRRAVQLCLGHPSHQACSALHTTCAQFTHPIRRAVQLCPGHPSHQVCSALHTTCALVHSPNQACSAFHASCGLTWFAGGAGPGVCGWWRCRCWGRLLLCHLPARQLHHLILPLHGGQRRERRGAWLGVRAAGRVQHQSTARSLQHPPHLLDRQWCGAWGRVRGCVLCCG
jgi:hypothetical protein